MRPPASSPALGFLPPSTTGCGDGGKDTPAAGSIERYCELIRILNKPPSDIPRQRHLIR